VSSVYVSHFASALGSVRQSVEQAEAAGQLFSPAAALRSAGFDSHHRCARDENSYQLAARALAASAIDPATIDAIVYSTCLPQGGNLGHVADFDRTGDVKHLMQFPASELQAAFGMHRAFVIGLNQQACTGMLGALRIGGNMLRAEPGLSNILCITADRFPQGARYEQAFNLISDGAAVCLLTRNAPGLRLLDVHHICNGAMVSASDDETAASYFNYSCRLVDEALERLSLRLSDIRWVVPQNTNRTAWKILARLLGLTPEQEYCPSMAACGHVISADNIINLASLCDEASLASGDRILTFMAGYGSNWQCALLEVR
jgi:3-oxoacyl-[acyl-carrier-protein] synthase III